MVLILPEVTLTQPVPSILMDLFARVARGSVMNPCGLPPVRDNNRDLEATRRTGELEVAMRVANTGSLRIIHYYFRC